ncbi:UNVERIFIED_CONTAM: hypothetical protein Sangu_2737300 [Sesamum angustifolium]|uniref:Uncharacterized protein n=1 Tax=Sesamum angustifolium TaxID=2727405 RepID=A0AAW2IVZ9_9LAMI
MAECASRVPRVRAALETPPYPSVTTERATVSWLPVARPPRHFWVARRRPLTKGRRSRCPFCCCSRRPQKGAAAKSGDRGRPFSGRRSHCLPGEDD